jgi:hypothetical protein
MSREPFRRSPESRKSTRRAELGSGRHTKCSKTVGSVSDVILEHDREVGTLTKFKLKQDGKAFHSFRWTSKSFWIGHANKDVTDRYAAQLKEDLEWRKDVAEKTGLGFAVSASMKISLAQRARAASIALLGRRSESQLGDDVACMYCKICDGVVYYTDVDTTGHRA